MSGAPGPYPPPPEFVTVNGGTVTITGTLPAYAELERLESVRRGLHDGSHHRDDWHLASEHNGFV